MILILILIGLIYFATLSVYKSLIAAGVEKQKALLPFINTMEFVRIIGRPKYQAFVVYLPIFNFFLIFSFFTDLSRCFGRTSFSDYLKAMIIPIVHFSQIPKTEKYIGTIPSMSKEVKSAPREWADSILFAVLAATLIRWSTFEAFTIPTQSMEGTLLVGDYLFVSKLDYGPRAPITPLQIPLTHQTIWFTDKKGDGTTGVKSYLDWIQVPYFRFPGITKIERNDIVVFNWPWDNGKDEMNFLDQSMKSWRKNDSQLRPIDLKTNYVKRCVAVAGDTLEIRNQQLMINGKASNFDGVIQQSYILTVDSNVVKSYLYGKKQVSSDIQVNVQSFEINFAEKFGLYFDDVKLFDLDKMLIHTTKEKAEIIKKEKFVKEATLQVYQRGEESSKGLYPYEKSWSLDFYGPLVIPKKGMTIQVTKENLIQFQHALNYFEGDDVRIAGKFDKLLVDGKEVKEYTFRQNYYYMIGDNRHNSLDSRTWGFVPENHVVGTPLLIWFSQESTPNKSFFSRIRWERLFKWVR